MEDKTTEKIDPKTGLTVSKDKPTGMNATQLVEFMRKNPTSQPALGQRTPGTFGDYGPGAIVTPSRNFNEIRAQGQTWGDLTFGAATQMAATVLGGAIEGVGYLGEALGELATGQRGLQPEDYQAGSIARLGKGIQEWAQQVAPIYQTELAQSDSNWRFADASFWAGNAPSIASTLALMAPGLIAAKGLSVLGNLAKASKGTQAFMATAGATFASREAEARMEAGEIYEQELNKYVQQGIPQLKAEELAKRTADDVYAGSYSNILIDAVQWGVGLRGVNWASRAANQKLIDIAEKSDDDIVNIIRQGILKNPDSSVKEIVTKFKPWTDFVGQMGMEGWEEFNIEIQKQRAIRNSQILTGETEGELRDFIDVYTSGEFTDLITPEAINATVFGALGGGVVGGAQRAFASYTNRQNQELEIKQANVLKEQARRVQQGLQNIDRFLQEGDTIAAAEEQKRMIGDLAVKGMLTREGRIQGSASAGTLDYNKQMFEAIIQLDDTELEQMGLDASARQQAEQSLSELERVEEIFNRNAKKSYGTQYDDVINAYISEQEYVNEVSQESINDYEKLINEIKSDEAITQLLDELNPSQRIFIENEKELADLKQIKKVLEKSSVSHAMQSPAKLGVFKQSRQEALKRVDRRIEQLEQDIVDAQGDEGLTKADVGRARQKAKTLYKTLDLGTHELSKRFRQINLAEGKASLSKLLESDNQAQIIKNIEAKDEQIRQMVSDYIIDQEYGEGAIVKKPGEDTLYKLQNVDGSYQIQPVDKELNYIEGSTPEIISDKQDFIENMELTGYESSISQKEFEMNVAEIERDLQNDNVGSAFDKLGSILKTPYAGDVNYLQESMLDELNKKLSTMESIKQIEQFLDNLNYVVNDDIIKRAINRRIKDQLNQIREVNQKRKERFNDLLTTKTEQAQSLAKELDKVSEQMEDIQSEVRKYEKRLRDTAERKNRTQKDILATHKKSIREPLNKAKEKVADDLSNLRGLRRKLKGQLNELNKDLAVIEKLREKMEADEGALIKVITQNELGELLGEVEAIRASTLLDFNLTEYGITKLRRVYEQGLISSGNVIDVLEEYKQVIDNLLDGNQIAINASQRAFDTLKESGELESEDTILTETALKRYESLYNKYLTEEIRKFTYDYRGKPSQLRRIANLTRYKLSGENIAEFVDNKFSPLKDQIEQNITRLRELSRVIPVYEQVLVALRKKEVKQAPPEIEKGEKKQAPVESFVPMRHPYEIWNGLTGNVGDTDAGLSKDPAQRRYGRFVNYNDINNMTDNLQISIVRPQQVGISLEGLSEKYDENKVLYALLQNKEGEFYLEDGTTTKEFNPDKNIYTSVPEATLTSHRLPKSYVIDSEGVVSPTDEEAARIHPDLPIKQARELVKKRIIELQKQHQQFRDYAFEQLDQGNDVIRNIQGKSLGILKETKDANRKSIASRFGKTKILSGDISLKVITSDDQQVNGYRLRGKSGYTILVDEFGNIVPLERRMLKTKEVNALIEALRYTAQNGEISANKKKMNTKVELPGIKKFVNKQELPVYFNNVFNYLVGSLTNKDNVVQIVNNGKPFGAIKIRRFDENSNEIFETYDILADSPDGKKLKELNPALEKALRQVLPDLPHNVLSAKTNEGESDVDSKFNYITFEDGSFKQTEYGTYKEYLVNEDVLGTYLSEAEDAEIEEGGAVIGSEKGLTHYNQRLYYDNSIEQQTQEDPIDTLLKSKSAIDQLVESKDTEKEAIKDLLMTEAQAEEETESDEEIDDLINKLKQEVDKELNDDDDEPPFQRNSNVKQLTAKQVQSVSKMLSNRTGIPIHILSTQRSLHLLNHLYEIGELDQQFTAETLPKGMSHKGIAYVFSNTGITADTPFHEVLHPIVNQMISDNPALIENIREEIINSPQGLKVINRIIGAYPNALNENADITNSGWAEIITTVIGEQAADKYYGKANQGLIAAVKRFWENIKQFFRERFGEGVVHIERMSADTTIGDIADMLAFSRKKIITTPSSVTQFQENDTNPILENIQPKYILEGRDSGFTRDAVQAVNFFFFNDLFTNRLSDLATLFTAEGMSPQVYNDILKSTKRSIANAGNWLTKEAKKGDRFDKRTLKTLLINYHYILQNFDAVADLHKKYLSRYNVEPIEDTEFLQENEKDAASMWVTEGLKWSSKRNATSDIRLLIGTLRSSQTNDSFYIPNNVDFATVFNLLANRLANTTSLDEMKNLIETSLSSEDGMKDLMDRFISKLGKNITSAQALEFLKFRKTFAKNFNNYYVLMMRDKVEEGEHNFTILNAHESTTKRKILEDWRANVNPSKPNFKESEGIVIYDIESMKRRGLLIENEDPKAITLKNNDYYLPSNPSKYSKIDLEAIRTTNFLSELGIELTPVNITDDIHNAANEIYKDLVQEKSYDVLSDELSDHRRNVFIRFVNHEAENVRSKMENSHTRSTGETIYNVNLYSHLTYIANKLNSNKYATKEELLNDLPHYTARYVANSKLLNEYLFDENGNRTANELKIAFVDEYKNDAKGTSITFDRLSPSDKTLVTINLGLNNSFPIFRAGDNSIERHIEMPEFFSSTAAKNGEYVQTIRDYLTDEINEILDIQGRSTDNQYNLVNTMSTEDLMNEFPIINLLSKDNQMKSAISQAIDGDNSAISTTDFGKRVRKVFSEYFNGQVEQTKNFLLDKKIIKEDGDQYINHGLSGLVVNDKKTHKKTELDNILRKFIVNRFIGNIEQTKLFTGPIAYYGNADNFFKRMSGIVGTKESLGVGEFENQMLNKLFPRNKSQRLYKKVQDGELTAETSAYSEGAKPILRTSVFSDPNLTSTYIKELEKILDDASAYQGMDEADAVGFISLDGYRDMMLRAGMWDMYLERLYQWEIRGDKTSITFYNWHKKQAEVIDRPSQLVNANGKRTVFNMMKPQYFGPLAEQGFIPAMYKTALMPILPSYAEGNEQMQQLLDYQNQFNVDIVTFPSANKVGTKLDEEGGIPQLFDEDGDIAGGTFQDTFYEYWGVQLDTGTSVKDSVVKGTQLMKLIFSNIYDKGGIANEQLAEKAGHLTSLNNQLIKLGVQELKQELGFEVEDGNYTLKHVDELVSFLETEAYKRNVNNNVLDSLAFLRENFNSSYAKFDMMSNRDKIENILASIADSRVISQKMPGGAKVQAPVTMFKDGLKRYTNDEAYEKSKKLKFYEEEGVMEVLLPHHFKKWADVVTVEDQLKKGIAFRIPTSGLNSIEHIKVVGYLPQSAGETIVVPSEIVAKVGSDFDVDKLNVFLPNYELVDGVPTYIEFNKEKGYAGNSRKALENELIKTIGEIVSHPDNRAQLLESIGNTDIKAEETHIIKKMGLNQDRRTALDIIGNFEYYMDVTNRNIESKQLTGIAALHTTDHVHATRYGYKLPKQYEIHLPHNETEDGLISLGHQKTEDGHYISSLLNQMINTAVDGAKEPIFYNLNMNLETANVIFYLIRAGVSPRNVFEFVNEPIIREYVSMQRAAKSITDYGVKPQLEQVRIEKRHPGKAKMLKLYKQYDQDSQVLNNYMQGTRIDTQAMGKNTSELDFVLYNADKIIGLIPGKASGIINADKLFKKGGYLSEHYKALQSIDEMYSQMFPTRTNEDFLGVYRLMLRNIADKKLSMDRKVKILDKLKADYITSSVLLNNSKIMNQDSLPVQYHDYLVRGKNSVAQRLQEYQQELAGSQKTNTFVEALQPVFSKKKYRYVIDHQNQTLKEDFIHGVKLFTQRMDTLDENDLIDAAREFAADRPQLFIDLVKLSFLQGGLQFTPMRYINLIPAEVYVQTIETGMRNSLSKRFNRSKFLANFHASNHADNFIVPTAYTGNTPDNYIYKRPIKKNVSKEKMEELIQKGLPIYEGKPVLHIDQELDAENMDIWGEFPEIEGDNPIFSHPAIRDNVNNISYLYYGDFGILSPAHTAGGQTVINETEDTITIRQAIEKLNNCR